MNSFTINLDSVIKLDEDQFYELCQANPDVKFERNAQGELIIMSPTGGLTGKYNSDINTDLNLWNRQKKLGIVFDSSTGFKLPNGADRSPDAAWIPLERWNQLSLKQQEKFVPLCPDFVIELRSSSDRLKTLQDKMNEYRNNGTLLGWLINRKDKQVEIYRQGQLKEVLNQPSYLSGEDILPDFVLNLESIW
ncbi:MAG: Uma2 family endonuclease [Xenococcus sp. MO_188.B8]|nr:Uma2 family endonuclease [Xenococcus sp. MO_188.B8]